MKDAAETPEVGRGTPRDLKPANENPWYILMTLYGEQEGETIDLLLHDKNRRAWQQWSSCVFEPAEPVSSISLDSQRRFTERSGLDLLEFSEDVAGITGIVDLSNTDFKSRFYLDGFGFVAEFHVYGSRFQSFASFEGASFHAGAIFDDCDFLKGSEFSTCIFGADSLFVF